VLARAERTDADVRAEMLNALAGWITTIITHSRPELPAR
jgi:hypothetical protein